MIMRILNIILLVGLVITGSSCKKYFDGKNTDPDNPMEVPPNIMLPGIQATLAYSIGGDAARYASIYTQHIHGDSRQWAVLQEYKFLGEDVNTLFEDNLYANVLVELNRMKKISDEKGYNHYNGIAKTMEAYTLLFIADFWNAAPYSEAFQGVDNLQPKYDTQAELYATIFDLLTRAESDLSQADGGSLVPDADDQFFAGDISQWIGFAQFIRARAYLHLAKADPTNYQLALNALSAGGLTADVEYGHNPNHRNPMFQFNQERGDCSIGGNLQTLVNSMNDPRAALYDQPFTEDNTFITDSKSVVLASIAEQNFILAECTFQVSGAAAAHPYYLAGINASFAQYGISGQPVTDYLAQNSVDPGAASLTLSHIMTQKYIALFMDPEVFNDWRRTDLPALTPNAGGNIPRRFPYPQQEVNLNANTPQTTIFASVDWDI